MSQNLIKYKHKLFKHYYLKSYTIDKIVLPELKFRHFRFQLFSKKISFRRLADVINSPTQLRDKFIRYVPMNAYFTPVKWLNPIYVGHTKDELDIMLSSPLYFDIDMQDLVPSTFSEAKRHTIRLIEFLKEEYGRQPDLVVFSGRQGFHVYFWDWDVDEILRLNHRDRLIEFKKRRNDILRILKKRKIIVDERITADPFRIMKIPNSLHGKTGLIAKPVIEVATFDPKKEAIAFDLEIYNRIFGLDWKVYK